MTGRPNQYPRINTYSAPTRTPTSRGELISFRGLPCNPPAPAFCADHPGIEFMAAISREVLAGHGAPGRWRINGVWVDERPKGFGYINASAGDELEEVAA